MSGPPANVSPSELWIALQQLPTAHRVVDFPVKDPINGESIGKVAIVPLSLEDLMRCKVSAEQFTKKFCENCPPKTGEENRAYNDVFSEEASVQILYRALRDPQRIDQNVFPAPAMLRGKLLPDAIAVLMRHYTRTSAEVGPIISYLSQAEMDAWVDALTEGGQLFPLDLLASDAQQDLIRHMASLLRKSRTVSTSVGTQPGDGSESTTDEAPPEVAPVDEMSVPPPDQIG